MGWFNHQLDKHPIDICQKTKRIFLLLDFLHQKELQDVLHHFWPFWSQNPRPNFVLEFRIWSISYSTFLLQSLFPGGSPGFHPHLVLSCVDFNGSETCCETIWNPMKKIRYSIYVNYISDRLKKLNPEIDQEDWQARYMDFYGKNGARCDRIFGMRQANANNANLWRFKPPTLAAPHWVYKLSQQRKEGDNQFHFTFFFHTLRILDPPMEGWTNLYDAGLGSSK